MYGIGLMPKIRVFGQWVVPSGHRGGLGVCPGGPGGFSGQYVNWQVLVSTKFGHILALSLPLVNIILKRALTHLSLNLWQEQK